MKRCIRLTICVAFAGAVTAGAGQQHSASQPAGDGKQEAPTTVDPYHFGEQLGETLDTFLSRRNDSVANVCSREEHPDKKPSRINRQSPPHLCADYTSGNATIHETSANECYRACRDMRISCSSCPWKAESQQRSWVFEDHKLANIITIYDGQPDREQQWRWLTEKYGTATSKRTQVYQNAFGARWECQEALWKLSDGEGVAAKELMGTDNAVWFAVDFQSPEAMLKAEKDPGKPNPY